MAHAPAAPDVDRLPWLTDTRVAPRGERMPLLLWGGMATALVAATSFWLGSTAPGGDGDTARDAGIARPSATISLPEPLNATPEVRPAPMPRVEPVAAPPPVPVAAAPTATRAAPKRARLREPARTAGPSQPPKAAPASGTLERWPARQVDGAAGRLIRIGAFDTRHSAKRGWVHTARIYPGFGGLPAVVVPAPSRRDGRTYYRIQVGTTSQAHSAVLCQWMRRIGQSCVVLDQPAA